MFEIFLLGLEIYLEFGFCDLGFPYPEILLI